MKLQVLVATMNQTDHSLLEKMNIHSDVIVSNQCDHNSVESFIWNGYSVKYLNFCEKGVGLNRNNALLRATEDFCLFADDDVEYYDNYNDIVCRAFEQYRNADVLIFNIDGRKNNKRYHRVWYHNYLRYGTVRIAIRLDRVRLNGIYFNQCFGGGSKYSHGEDNLFLTQCLKNGLKVYAVPKTIGKLSDGRASTWNNGYDGKYLNDQGVLYYAISKKCYKLLCFQDSLRHHKKYNKSFVKCYKAMIKGAQELL